MTMDEWLERERQRDAEAGLPPTITDPTALGLLAVFMHEARQRQRPTDDV